MGRSTVLRWANGTQQPKSIETEQRVEAAYQVYTTLLEGNGVSRSNHGIRAWLIGMNPQLDDESPAEVLASGDRRRVMAAVRAYLTGG